MDFSNDYPKDKPCVCWIFSLCTNGFRVLENEKFFGKIGTRTIFIIEYNIRKEICKRSSFLTEDEIQFISTRQFKVISNFNAENKVHIIPIREGESPFSLLLYSPKILLISSTIQSYQNKVLEHLINKCWIGSEINLRESSLEDQLS